jgi:imidazolonepropionase-like amidohydrolase
MPVYRPILLLITCLSARITFAQHTTLIRNIYLVDVEKGIVKRAANVLIRDSIITSVNYRKSAATADTIIDGSGKYLIPGLWDMHTHVWSDEYFFPLLIANGVTGIRDMFESVKAAETWKKKIAEGRIYGPEMRIAGPILDGPKPIWPGSVAVSTPEEGRRAVDSLKDILHTDFIKVYSLLSRESYFAIADEARKKQIPFAGHVPNVVSVSEAAKAGQKSQEHLYGFLEEASDSADYLMQVVQGKIKDSALSDRSQRMQFLFRTYNIRKLEELLHKIKTTGTWICPTLTVLHAIGYLNDTTLQNDPRMQYMIRGIRNGWDPRKDPRFSTWTPGTFNAYQQDFAYKLRLVKALRDAGIPLLAGTDFPNPYCFPGFGLHEELQWMVKAGLTPAEALQTATINPARYFGIEQRTGSIAEGKTANLVILEANPLLDISNTQKIGTVILRGKVLHRAALQALLDKARKIAGPL